MKKFFTSILTIFILVAVVSYAIKGCVFVWHSITGGPDNEGTTWGVQSETKDNEIDETRLNKSSNNNNDGNYTNLAKITNTEFSKFLIKEYTWAEDKGIFLNKYDELNTVAKWYDDNLDKITNDMVYIKKNHDSYKLTLKESDYLYYGDIKNEEPNGLGIIIYRDTKSFGYEGVDYTDFIVHLGYFEDGKYNGYGLSFNIPDYDDPYYYDNLYVSEDLARTYIRLFNNVNYEGYFTKGERDISGNEYSNTFIALVRSNYDKNIIESELGFWMTIGETKNNAFNGEVIYYNENGNKIYEGLVKNGSYIKGKKYSTETKLVEYEGEFKNDKFHGEGKKYFAGTNQVEYEGEFKNNEYDGKGILYDKEGNILYDGMFTNGDIR